MYMQQISRSTVQENSQAGDRGQAQLRHAYSSLKSGSRCAFKAARNLQDVRLITAQTMKKEDEVMEPSQVKTSAPVSAPVSCCKCKENLEPLTRQIDVSQHCCNGQRDGQTPPWPSPSINFCQESRDESLLCHSTEHSRRYVDALNCDTSDPDHDDNIEKIRNSGNTGVVHGNDERGGCRTRATEEALVIHGDHKCAQHHA